MKKGKPFLIYDPDDSSPEIRNLIEDQKSGWKTELAKAVARYVIDELNKQEQDNGAKNTKL